MIIPAYASQLELTTLSLGDNVNGSIQDLCNLNNYCIAKTYEPDI